ncbi:flavodoxin family protein [Longivirga aurantiaca]|uniref:Flavodoxin family protein n=1 Tax=Longivirga aurantiaca TaxID=1837743 RepID=A0ABW1T1Y9_9ACTN
MTTLVVYESMFGNTREIAQAVARGLAPRGSVEVLEIGELRDLPSDLELLVVGGPTHAFGMSRPQSRQDARTKSPDGEVVSDGAGLREVLAGLHRLRKPIPAAVFDTKVRKPLTGSAGKGAAKALKAAGFRLIADPEDFGVQGTMGPLEPGEVERAEAWGAHLSTLLASASQH